MSLGNRGLTGIISCSVAYVIQQWKSYHEKFLIDCYIT